MPVYLRKKQLKEKSRYYLDIYYNGHRRYEMLDLYQLNSRHPVDVISNREHKELAEKIRAKRELELTSQENDIRPKHKDNTYFIEYFDKWLREYRNKDLRLAKACYTYFLRFLTEKGIGIRITTREVTKDLVKKFKQYLDDNLNGETPYNYFGKFIKLCNDATETDLFRVNPCKGIKNIRSEGLKKDVLSIDEVKALKEATCSHIDVKRAFLFCLNTGLRWVDVSGLKWKHIDGDMVKLMQAKTGKEVVIYLNDAAMNILAERGKRNDLVFNLPSSSYASRALKQWVENAGIDKHISWHCARHSFAVNVLTHGADVKTVSSLLGHAGLKHTEKYTRVVDDLKRKAVQSINF